MSRAWGCRNSKIGLKGKVFQVKGAECLGNLTHYNSLQLITVHSGGSLGGYSPQTQTASAPALQVSGPSAGVCWSGTRPDPIVPPGSPGLEGQLSTSRVTFLQAR